MSWAELNITYCIQKCPKTNKRPNKGFFYLSVYVHSKTPVLDNPSSDKHRQGKFFLLSKAWKNEHKPLVRRNFAKKPCSLHKSVLHGEEEVERIRMVVNSEKDPNRVYAIITYERMASTGVIPLMLAMGRFRNPYFNITRTCISFLPLIHTCTHTYTLLS